MLKRLHLLFIRHGQTQDNVDTILQGHRDTALTDQGHDEAKVLAEKVQQYQIDVVYHSPLTRILQTLAPFLSEQPGLETHVDADLKSQCLGELEGQKYDTIDMTNPRSADGQPGVERFDDFVNRLKRSLARIIGRESGRFEEGRTSRVALIATHGVCITSIFRVLEDTPPCDGFNGKLAVRGPEAFEVRWTDSDDVARTVLDVGDGLPVRDGVLQWDSLEGQPFLIELWGKREKAL